MRIESINIRGFGCLRNRNLEFPSDKAVLVVERNETGKSTLAEAILAGLCGFPRERRAEGKITLLDTYKPWNGDSYALELRIEAQGRRYVVERDFARNAFVVREAETNRDVTGQFEQDLSLQFLKLPREDYIRIAFICGKEVTNFDSSTSLKDRLSALVEGSADSAGAEKAIQVLENARWKFDDGKDLAISTAISRLKKDIEQKESLLKELDDELDSAGQDLSLREKAQNKLNELTSKRDELDAEKCAARLRETRNRLENANADAARIAELREELASLQCYANFPADRSAQLAEAIGRIEQLKKSLDQAKAQQSDLENQNAKLSAELDNFKLSPLASNDDVTSLRAAKDKLRDAKLQYEQALGRQKQFEHSPLAYLAKAAIAFGLLGAIASVCLMILQVISPVLSGAGAIFGIVIAAGGLASRFTQNKSTVEIEYAKSILDSAESDAKRRLANIGVECPPGAELSEILSRAETSLSQYLRSKSDLEDIQRKLKNLEVEIHQIQKHIDSECEFINSILSDAGIDTALPLSEAYKEFKDAEKRYRRMREINDTLLPELEKRAMSEKEIEQLRAEERDLTDRMAGFPNVETSRSSSEIENEQRSVALEFDTTKDEIMEIDRRISAKVDKYRSEYPKLREEVCSLSAELEKVERFQKALKLAADTMHEVVESTRRRWAEALNKQSGEILPHLNPDYDNLLFDESLNFTLKHVANNRIIPRREAEAQLSTGAKDQIFLAVRLACCRELSRLSEPIPVILDDPLIAADDDRFARAFRYLVEALSREQQVIILSCHHSRHERFFQEEWFRRSVEIIDLS